MKYLTLLPCAFITLTLLGVSSYVKADPGEDLIKQGDVCDAKLHAADALKFYLDAEKTQPKNALLLVSIARQYRHLMSDATDEQEKQRLGNLAFDYSKRAEALAPSEAQTHLAVAISYGKIVPFLSNREKIEASPRIKAALDKALRLDPQNDIAWHVLGRWYEELAEVGSMRRALAKMAYGELPTGTFEDAARCFEKAVRLNPSRPMHFIALGVSYARLGRCSDARRCLEKGLALPNTEKDDPAMKHTGRQELASLP